MLRRWKERVRHDARKALVSFYALIAITLLPSYLASRILEPWIDFAILAAGFILAFIWLAWIMS